MLGQECKADCSTAPLPDEKYPVDPVIVAVRDKVCI